MNYSQLLKERKEIKRQIILLQDKLKELPEGELLCNKSGKYIRWLKCNGANPIYIPKGNRELAEILAVKKYYTLQVNELQQELQTLDICINRYQKLKTKASDLLDDSSHYKELLETHFKSFENISKIWLAEEYPQNTNHPEHLVHKTLSGHNVRSKSEVIIANALFTQKIPYRYECQLQLDDIYLYPDFTICHPKNQQIFYWEHFGMMNNPTYRGNAFNKLKIYGDHDIIPSFNLITTYETQANPINSKKVYQTIEEYFL